MIRLGGKPLLMETEIETAIAAVVYRSDGQFGREYVFLKSLLRYDPCGSQRRYEIVWSLSPCLVMKSMSPSVPYSYKFDIYLVARYERSPKLACLGEENMDDYAERWLRAAVSERTLRAVLS